MIASQSINERLTAGEKIAVGWPWRFFSFTTLVLTVAVVFYAGLKFGYEPLLRKKLDETDLKLQELAQSLSAAEQEDLITFYSQLANLEALLGKHVLASVIFPFLERNTNQQVYYTMLNFESAERKLTLEGAAQSYGVFSQQLQAFEQAPEVKRLIVSDSDRSGGLISFRLHLVFKP